jgi:hypothetical protein
MPKVQMITTMAGPGGRATHAGETVEVSDEFAAQLIAGNFARAIEPPEAAIAPPSETAQAAPAPEAEVISPPERASRRIGPSRSVSGE